MTTPTGATAPSPPGGLGTPLDTDEALEYLGALGTWRDERRLELDALDQAALQSPDGAAVTGDIMLSMAVWKSASDRYDLLLATWDSGRVARPELERMSSLIWGRLDTTIDPALLSRSSTTADLSGLAVSLPEACRLSDALVSQLRVRLSLDTSDVEVTERVRQLRVQLERIRDQVGLEEEPASRQKAEAERDDLTRRLTAIVDKAGRGGDVGGLLGPLELDATRFERDLIVGAATRRETEARADRARVLRADLIIRSGALKLLVDQCVAAVDTSPRYAVPDVQALGPAPTTSDELDDYLKRLEQVSRAMTMAQDAYAKALHERDELAGRLDAYRAKAEATGHIDADAEHVYGLARRELAGRPVRMALASQLVTLYQSYLDARPSPPSRPQTPTEAP